MIDALLKTIFDQLEQRESKLIEASTRKTKIYGFVQPLKTKK